MLASLVGPAVSAAATLVPLDRLVCKYSPNASCAAVAVADEGVALTCPGCGGRLEPAKGTWTGVRLERTTRTALTAQETAKESHLYSRDALSSDQAFHAEAWAEDLSWLDQVASVRVGGRRTVGGRVKVSAEQCDPEPPAVSGATLRVRCLSPAVFLNEFGANVLRPSSSDLARSLGAPLAEAPVVRRSWCRPGTVGGWHHRGGLPKATEVCAVAGSVFEIDFGREVTSDEVLALERSGLGVRREDGYGWVTARPWQAPSRPVEQGRSMDYASIKRIAQSVDKDLVRRCLGWLREGVTAEVVAGAAAFTDLTPAGRAQCLDVLRFNEPPIDDLRKRALIVALEVRL